MLEVYSMLKAPCKDALGRPAYAGPMQTQGERIRALRQAKGLTQEQLGKVCGVTGAAVSMWENGGTLNLKGDGLFKLLRALGTDLGYLLYGPDRIPPEELPPRARSAS
jgi:transcriptional regulator with XRE-family HTH domain